MNFPGETSDAILLNLELPDNQGMAILKKIMDVAPRVPVVVLTALADEGFGAAVVQQGAQDYLVKSQLNPDLLARSLRYAVERHQTRMALRESEERLRLAIDAAFQVSFEWDILRNEVRRFVSLDPALPPTAKQGPSTFEAVREVVHPEDRELFTANVRAALDRNDGRYENEYRVVHPDGQVAWLYERGLVERDKRGRPARLIGLSQVITERKRAEEALKAAHMEAVCEKKRLEAVMEALPVGVAILDDRGGNIQSNRMFDQVWGAPRPLTREIQDYAAYKAWWVDTGTPVKPEEWASAYVVKKGETVVGQCMEIEKFDGQHRFVLNSAAPILDAEGQVSECAVAILDITELQEAKKALRESEAWLKMAQEAARAGTWDWNLLTGKLTWNENCYTLMGLSPDNLELSVENWMEKVHPEDCHAAQEAKDKALQGKDFYLEYRALLPDGGTRWLNSIGQTFFVDGRPVRMAGICLDITGRKQAEEALRQSEARERERAAELQGVLDTAPSPIIMAFSQDVKYMIGNPAAYELLHLPVGSNVSRDAPDEDRPGYKVFKSGRELSSQELPLQRAIAGEIVQDFEFELALADGTVRQVSANAVPLFDELGAPRGGVTVLTDLTAYKKSEEALRKAHDELERRVKDRTAELERVNEALQQSEENLRFLTSQILTAQEKERKRISYELHEGLGQSLTVLKMHLRDIQRMMPPSGPERDKFESVLNYMNNIVEDIRRLSRDLSPLMLEDLGLPAALKNLFEETCMREGKDCSFKIEDIHTLLSLEEQLIIYRVSQEILNNVIKHAQATRIEVVVQRLDNGVQFSVADNGVGFDVDQTLAGLLKARGMGLAYMKEQVRMLGGAISISSKVGEGTKINITVPIRRRQFR